MREEILKLLENGKALDMLEISKSLGYTKDMDELLASKLTEMVNNYDLHMTNKGRYMLFKDNEKNTNYFKGKFMDTNGTSGFVRVEGMNKDIYIHGSNINGAINGDEVLVYVTREAKGEKKAEGTIVKIINREVNNKVGEIYHYDGKMMVSLDDKKYKKLIYLKNTPDTERLVDGDKVVVSFTGAKQTNDYIQADFVKRIGHIDDPGIDILSIIVDCEINTEFSDEYLEQLKTIPTEVRECDIAGREDYRDRLIYTIDGDNTKDFDDAICIEKLPNGNYLIGVHIADVPAYIEEDSPIDLEARRRGTSGYFGNTVNPMYHHQISNGICSLKEDKDRLTVSYIEEIDSNGKCVNHDIKLSVIHSKKRMTYKEVNKILEENTIPEGYEKYADNLRLASELADLLYEKSIIRGYVDFGTTEPDLGYINNVINSVNRKDQHKAERLIEMFMVRANVGIGTIMYHAGIPSIYRNHGEPDEDRLNHFLELIASLGINLKTNVKNKNAKTIQAIVEELKGYTEYRVLATKILSTMDKATYSSENLGHFALALKIYLHFTSPIRRYPDTCVIRALHKFYFHPENMVPEKIDEYYRKYTEYAIHSSEMERVNEKCERMVDKLEFAKYMSNHIGEEYEGMISGVTEKGFFVQLDNLIEGLVRYDSFEDKYSYDEVLEMVKIKDKLFKLGQKVKIRVLDVSTTERQIDFGYVGDIDEKETEKTR